MPKSKVTERVQEVILPDFPDDDNTVTTVTKSRRVSFGTNFVKEFIVGSAVSGQCLPEYEQAFPSSDSSNADSSHSGAGSGILGRSGIFSPPHETHKVHKPVPPVGQPGDSEFGESRPKLSRFQSTVCFSADSPSADVEFTEGCLSLAKSILEKKNKEMTVFIQAKSKDDEKGKEDETKYFDGSQLEMSMTRRFKPKANKREEKNFESERTKIFGKFEDEMSVTRCNRIFNEDDMSLTRCSKIFNNEAEGDDDWEDCKENRMPLDMMIRFLDKDSSDMEKDLFNPEKTLGNFLNADPFDSPFHEGDKLNLNESVDISVSFQSNMFKGSSEIPASPTYHIRKSTSFHEFLTFNGEKSAAGPPTTADTINEMSLSESGDVFTSEREADPPSADDKMNRSTASQMDLDEDVGVSASEREPFVVEPTVTDQKINKSKSLEMDKLETEPFLADMSNDDKVNKSTEQGLNGSDDGLASEATATVDKSPEKMSLDGSNGCILSGQTQSLVESQETDDKVNKSQPMSLDESNGGILSEQTQPLGKPEETDDKINQSRRMSLDESNGGLLSEQTQPLGNATTQETDDKVNKSQRMSLNASNGGLLSEQTQSLGKPEETDDKINQSQPMSLDESNGGLISEPEQPLEKLQETDDKINKSQGMSLNASNGGLLSEPAQSPGKLQETDNKVNKSQPLSLDESNGGLFSEQASAVVEPQKTEINKSQRMSLDGTEDVEPSMVDLPPDENKTSESPKRRCLNEEEEVLASQKEPSLVDVVERKSLNEVVEPERRPLVEEPPATDNEMNKSVGESLNEADEESTSELEPSLWDLKVVESLKEQSKESDCVWSLKDFHHPRKNVEGSLSFNCTLLESSTVIHLGLKISKEDSLDACSIVKNSEVSLNKETNFRLPEYGVVVDFGFEELKNCFDERRTKLETIRHVPYFMDQINSFMLKTNACLRQIYIILTSYPGSRLEGSILSFRLYSFPVFFSCTVSIDLSKLYRLTKSSLSFEHDFGSLDENKIGEIFQNCSKCDNSLLEFVVQSTKYIIELEKESGYVSKRQHIKLLPAEMKL